MRMLDVKFHCRMATAGLFSAYKGSMLRGALGASLHRGLCMARRNDCRECMLAANCIFPRVFSASKSAIQGSSAPLLTPPFCIEPPEEAKRHYLPEERFSFSLKLFSFAVEYLPFFAHAFSMAGERGIGNPQEPGRFYIEDITQGDRSIFNSEKAQLMDWNTEELPLPRFLPNTEETCMHLRLQTPLRFKMANHLAATLEFRTLFTLILRRMRSLWALDGLSMHIDEEEFAAIRSAGECVRIAGNHLRWQEWSRYSSRQETKMNLGGLLGEVEYHGPLGAFAEFMGFAAKTHIGKQTSFGLGALACSF